ncbi:MAG TPA: 3-isopropylmalate dehydratase small subunit [Bordetella sp.]
MEPLVRLRAVACALPQINIDTDQVLPARFMKQPRNLPEGYAPFLFHDLRRLQDGAHDGQFPLNQPRNHGARILVAGRNFGSGSSREAAVYALADAGIRCVIAPSHGDIFASNAVNNGLLPARVDEAAAEAMFALLAPGGVEAEVDLEACRIEVGGQGFDFHVDPVWRLRLINGWDDIDTTRRYDSDVAAWLAQDALRRPWAGLPANPA